MPHKKTGFSAQTVSVATDSNAETSVLTAHDSEYNDDTNETTVTPIVLQLLPPDAGVRLDKVLARHLPQFSRGRIQHWIEAGRVQVDGVLAHAKSAVFGDEQAIVLPQVAPEEMAFVPEPMDLAIVFEDASILVINKPAGLVVHPGAGNWSGTLLNGLLHYNLGLSGVPRAGIVHRLDKDTSGLMVIAKTLEAHTDLVRQLQARTVTRQYMALVWGTPQINGTVDAPIGRHPRDRLKMAVISNANAKPAMTHYRRLGVGQLGSRVVSLMQCQLETGRTHQIRVHMQSLGFPLVGDATYGKPHLADVFSRQALQAWKLGLVHPTTRQPCTWQVPLAADFAALLRTAGIELPETEPLS